MKRRIQPDVRFNPGQWVIGVEFWGGLFYLYLGPIELMW